MSRTPVWARAAGATISLLGVLAGPTRASDTRSWRLLVESAASPPSLQVPLGLYDPVRHRVLAIDAGYENQPLVVYVFDPSPEPRWSTLVVANTPPQQQYLASIVYDPVRDRMLLFGAQTSAVIGVWALSLSGTPAWQQLVPKGLAPQPRTGHSTVYDPVHDRVILFGGADGSYPTNYLSDTWAYSLASDTWSLLVPGGWGPGGREGHGAIYDPQGGRMLLFGGHFDNGTRGFWNDLWQLSLGDTVAWAEIHATGPIPGARSAFGTTYDPVRLRMLIHGGVNADSGVEPDNLWALSLGSAPAWTPINTEDTLRGRSYPIDAYDPVEDRLLACGGGGYPQTSALSLPDPIRWSAVLPTRPPAGPSARTGHAVVHDTRRDRFVVVGGAYSTADSAIWSFDPESPGPWQSERAEAAPGLWPGMEYSLATVYDSVGDRIILFDGVQAWSSPGAGPRTWTPLGQLQASSSPSVGFGAGVALDSRRNRLIVTGGWIPYPHSSGFSLSGVWSLSLGPDPTWTRVGTLPQPYGSASHASFYDPIRDRLVLLGGWWIGVRFGQNSYGAAVWSTPLDSMIQWTALTSTSGVPAEAPPDGQATFDPRLDRMYVFADSTAWTRAVDDTGPWTELQLSTPGPVVTSPVIYDPVRDQVLGLFSSTAGSDSVQAWAVALGPLSATLIGSNRIPDAIEMTWRSTTAVGRVATIERREAPADWVTLGPLAFDVRGLATFADHAARPGHDYTYRVGVADGDSTWHSDAVLIAQPGSLRLALLGARPNPAVGNIQLAFSLPASGPARIELFDLRGRRCLSREVGPLGAGTHWMTLEETAGLRPGVYFARLQRAGETRSTRVVLVR